MRASSTRLRKWRSLRSQAIAAFAALAMGLGMVGLTASAAHAAPEDAIVATVMKQDGTPVAAGEVIPEGTALMLRVVYQKQNAPNDLTGTTHQITMGTNVTVGAPPAGNTAISNVAAITQGIEVTFENPWPAGIDQGYLDLNFTMNSAATSGPATIFRGRSGEAEHAGHRAQNDW